MQSSRVSILPSKQQHALGMSLVGKRTRWIVALGGLNWGTLTLMIKNLHVSQIGLVNYQHNIS